MTYNKNCLQNIKPHREKIFFPNGIYVETKFKDTYIGYINENKIILKNVYYIPSFKINLLSTDQLLEEYFKIMFYKKIIIRN